MRSRGCGELARALAQRGFSPACARAALERLEREGWLDDQAAARGLVRSWSARYGRTRIERELAARGFSDETIAQALSEAEGPGEAKSLELAFGKLWASTAQLPREKRRRRVWSALLRRGFAAQAISAMIKGRNEVDGGS